MHFGIKLKSDNRKHRCNARVEGDTGMYLLLDLFLYFIVYSFIGWLMETIYASITQGKFVNRGFLIGPLTPIYGFGAILILLSSKWVENVFYDYYISILMTVLISTLLVTVLEFCTGYVLEKVFNTKWWDYSKNAFNIKGYICLKFSLLWGMLAFLLIEIVHPYIELIISIIPITIKGYISALSLICLFVDAYKSVISTLDLRNAIINYSDLPLGKYKDKIIKYKRIFLAFPRLLLLNEDVSNRGVRSILNGRINKIKVQIKKRFQT